MTDNELNWLIFTTILIVVLAIVTAAYSML